MLVTPIEDPQLRENLSRNFDVQLADASGAWKMQSDGSYRRTVDTEDQPHSQQILVEDAEKRQTESGRLRKRKPRGIARRSVR